MKKQKEIITAKTCQECGACCVSLHDQDSYCDIDAVDMERLGKRFVRLHVLQPSFFERVAHAIDRTELPQGVIKTKWLEQKSGPFKGVSACACVALKGSLFRKVRCAVYEKRPRVCRTAVVPGDRWCRELRRLFREVLTNAMQEAS